ncbi:hypothetical protein Tco_0272131 [Tanacetum coccineum]
MPTPPPVAAAAAHHVTYNIFVDNCRNGERTKPRLNHYPLEFKGWECVCLISHYYHIHPADFLEDDCLNAKDLTLSLMGRVKEMASLVNLKKALCNEGFDVVKISYLGELWVLLEFETAKAKDSFRGRLGLVWNWHGFRFKFWSGPTFKRIAAKWGELLDVDDYDESNLHSKRICILSKVCEHIHESFKIVFRGKVYWVRASEVLGWTPEFSEEEEEDESLCG